MEERYQFDNVTMLSAVAVGEPGKRTFFLAIGQQGKWVRVWLEKDHLQSLAMAVRQLLFTLSQQPPGPATATAVTAPPDEVPSGLPSVELEITEMALGYDGEKATVKVSAHGVGPRKADATALDYQVTLAQLRELGRQADAACAPAGPGASFVGVLSTPPGTFVRAVTDRSN